MEVYKLSDNCLLSLCDVEDIYEGGPDGFIVSLKKEDVGLLKDKLNYPERAFEETISIKQNPLLEDYGNRLFITVNDIGWHPKKEDWLLAREINILISKNVLVFVTHGKYLRGSDLLGEVIGASSDKNGKMFCHPDLSLGRLLYLVLDKLLDSNRQISIELEKRITNLEDEIISETIESKVDQNGEHVLRKAGEKAIEGKKKTKHRKKTTKIFKNHMDEIIHKRKQIIFLKRYFEPLEDITEQLSDSGSEVIPKDMEKHFYKLAEKARRNIRTLGNLRDYVTQVREAWQAQIDIGLNSIMKIFTVVSTIFFPLTLIAGWYGMNFHYMPEISWKYGYAFAFGLSIIVVAVSLWFFRKNRYI